MDILLSIIYYVPQNDFTILSVAIYQFTFYTECTATLTAVFPKFLQFANRPQIRVNFVKLTETTLCFSAMNRVTSP